MKRFMIATVILVAALYLQAHPSFMIILTWLTYLGYVGWLAYETHQRTEIPLFARTPPDLEDTQEIPVVKDVA